MRGRDISVLFHSWRTPDMVREARVIFCDSADTRATVSNQLCTWDLHLRISALGRRDCTWLIGVTKIYESRTNGISAGYSTIIIRSSTPAPEWTCSWLFQMTKDMYSYRLKILWPYPKPASDLDQHRVIVDEHDPPLGNVNHNQSTMYT